jgi:hypothetical protein
MRKQKTSEYKIIGLRIPTEILDKLDRYREMRAKRRGWRATRSAAIREIVCEAITAEVKP